MSTRPNTFLEHLAHGRVLAFLDGGQVTVTGVIDEHVDAAEMLFGLGDGVVDLGTFGDIQRQHEGAIAVTFDNVRDFRGVTRRDHRTPAALQHEFRQFAAKACGTASDQPDGVVSIHHLGNSCSFCKGKKSEAAWRRGAPRAA